MHVYVLDVETFPDRKAVRLRLSDAHERQLAAHEVRLADHPAWQWEGLFDTRTHVRRYAGSLRAPGRTAPATAEELLAELGVFLGTVVLGRDISDRLAAGLAQRSLVVRLPAPTDPLAAAFAGVPWEMAAAAPGERPLYARNVAVRALNAGTAPGIDGPETVCAPEDGEDLRVLLVFAHAPGSRPLALRAERERLLGLLFQEIAPRRRVRLDVLCHGVSRTLLTEQIKGAGGYHVVHWSGHGHHDRLELHGDDGRPDRFGGAELVDVFRRAGGFLPRVVFLSACHSGALLTAKSWDELIALVRAGDGGPAAEAEAPDREGEAPGAPDLQRLVRDRAGYTATALALLGAGIPHVVAMRYAVGDAYAADLSERFYRHLLADDAPKTLESALALARAALAEDAARAADYHPVDHATPLVFGATHLRFAPPEGRSAQLDRRRPRPQPLLERGKPDLDPPARFVGRDGPLTRLHREWLRPADRPVALVQGLAGLGKTARRAWKSSVALGNACTRRPRWAR